MQKLIERRIDILNSFSLLSRLDKSAASDILLGRHLNPDTKFGGYTFELSDMLDELVEVGGTQSLAELFRSPGIPQHRLNDVRVLEALSEALDVETHAQCKAWLNKIREHE